MAASDAGTDAAGGQAPSQVPVTLLTGFLGAGKTTLLNAWLKETRRSQAAGEAGGLVLGVLENEFVHEIGLEELEGAGGSTTTSSSEAAQPSWMGTVYEFGGGCLCCSASGEFERVLDELLVGRTSEAGASGSVNHIVVETTGLAQPKPVVRALRAEPRVRVHAVVTVVDALNVRASLHDPARGGTESVYVNETYLQIVEADVVILNKTDLIASAAELAAVRAEVEAVLGDRKDRVRIVEASFGNLPARAILGDSPDAAPLRDATRDRDADAAAALDPHHDEQTSTEPGAPVGRPLAMEERVAHHPGLLPAVIVRPTAIDKAEDGGATPQERLARWAREVARDCAADKNPFRIKGVFNVAGEKYQLQGAGIAPPTVQHAGPWTDDGALTTVVIFSYATGENGGKPFEASLRGALP